MKIIKERKLVGSHVSMLKLCEQVIDHNYSYITTYTRKLEDTKTCIYNARHFVKCKFRTMHLQKTMNIVKKNSFDLHNVHFKNKIACKQFK